MDLDQEFGANESVEARDLSGSIHMIQGSRIFVGTYSDVYCGTWNETKIAIKIIKGVISTHVSRRKMRRERTIWAQLNHPNILPFYGYAEDSKLFGAFGALISPWYPNGDSMAFLAVHGREMTVRERLELWRGVVSGIDYLHSCIPVIVHGDIKPTNILIDDNRVSRICDFGLVRIILEEGSTTGMTTTTQHTGTERYLAYELVVSDDDDEAFPTTASDIWALGCVGLEFLFLQVPYANRRSNLQGRIVRDIGSGIPPATQPIIPDDETLKLWKVIESCWNLDPQSRPTPQDIIDGVTSSSSRSVTPRNPIQLDHTPPRLPVTIDDIGAELNGVSQITLEEPIFQEENVDEKEDAKSVNKESESELDDKEEKVEWVDQKDNEESVDEEEGEKMDKEQDAESVKSTNGPVSETQADKPESISEPVPELPSIISVEDHDTFMKKHLVDLGTEVEETYVFTWKLTNWRRLDKKLHSSHFSCGGREWRVLIFPFGNMNKKKNDSISFYLDYAGPTDPKDWHACAQFALALSNPYDPTNYLVDTASHRFTAAEADWGFTNFCDLRKLFLLNDGHDQPVMEDESATLTVFVRVMKDPDGQLWK